MTREEAKEVFLNRGFIDGIYNGDKWREACVVISNWLEQESTAKNDLAVDCVNRVELLKAMDTWDKFGDDPNKGLIPLMTPALQDRYVAYVKYDDMVNCVKSMPLVTPQPRKGHWENGKELGREYQGKTLVDITYEDWHCSNCHCVIEQSSKPKWNYCPNCGADMREVKE